MQEKPSDEQKWAPVNFKAFQASLEGSRFFQSLPPEGQQQSYDQYLEELKRDYEQQIEIIELNTLGQSEELMQQGKQLIGTIRTVAHSPAFFGFPLEELIVKNWGNGEHTLANLLVDRAHEIFSDYTFAPARKAFRGEKQSRYGRYDLYKHPIYREYLDNVVSSLLGIKLDDIESDPGCHAILMPSGSSTIKRILEAVRDTRHVLLPDSQARRMHIYQANRGVYFETSKVLESAVEATVALHTDDSSLLQRTSLYNPEPLPSSWPQPRSQADITLTELPHEHQKLEFFLQRALAWPGVHVFWIENIGNNPEMDVPDVQSILTTIKAHASELIKASDRHKIMLCIDVSILSGPVDELLQALSDADLPINVIIISSLMKFMTLGVNKANLGFIYGQGPDMQTLFKHIYSFQTTEGYPSLHTVAAMPRTSRELLMERKKRFSDNAQSLAQTLAEKYEQDGLTITYPGLSSHPDNSIMNDQYDGFGGPFFFISFANAETANNFVQIIHEYDSELIDVGASYGFNKTRLELRNSTIPEEESRVVRVSVGTENVRQLMLVLQALEDAIDQVI